MKNQEKWELALQKFAKGWEDKKEVVGMIACGSYITGNPSKHSDIDIHIILDKNIKWRERGNKIVDGIVMEYFANPASFYVKNIRDNFNDRSKIDAHMFGTGEIIFDKTGELKKIIQRSRKYLFRDYRSLKASQVEIAKYGIWDMRDNLEEVFDAGGEEFYFVFYNFLNELFDDYAGFLGFDGVSVHKIRRFLTNANDRKKYIVKDFPDEKFVKVFIDSMRIKDKKKMMTQYNKLTDYVLDRMGGFNIDGWKIRTPFKK